MTDQPGRTPQERLPVPRPSSDQPVRRADRFTSPAQVRNIGGLTPERLATIVRQSGSARWVAFLAVSIVSLFVILYYFYEVGAPFKLTTPRLDQQADVQQVISIERGYTLYEANCARCHGTSGEGGIGPKLNDQMKLFAHLNEQYIRNVLTVGGRYVCGNANSQMPVWADTNGGPLNYIAINDLIAFLRAPSTEEFVVKNPELNEPVIGADGKVKTFKGWVDPSFKPLPSSSPVPDCHLGNPGTPKPQGTLGPGSTVLDLIAEGVKFDKSTLSAPAGATFGIKLTNNDPATPHDVDIQKDGATVVDNATINGVSDTTYVIASLDAGAYTFICSVHPTLMSGTLTVK